MSKRQKQKTNQGAKKQIHAIKDDSVVKKNKDPKFKGTPIGKITLINKKAQNKNVKDVPSQKNIQKDLTNVKDKNKNLPKQVFKSTKQLKQDSPKKKKQNVSSKTEKKSLKRKFDSSNTDEETSENKETTLDDSLNETDDTSDYSVENLYNGDSCDDYDTFPGVNKVFGHNLQKELEDEFDSYSSESSEDDNDDSEEEIVENKNVKMVKGPKSEAKKNDAKKKDKKNDENESDESMFDESDEDDEDESEEEDEDESEEEDDEEKNDEKQTKNTKKQVDSSMEIDDDDDDKNEEKGVKVLLGKTITDSDDDDDEDFNEEDEDDQDDDINSDDKDDDINNDDKDEHNVKQVKPIYEFRKVIVKPPDCASNLVIEVKSDKTNEKADETAKSETVQSEEETPKGYLWRLVEKKLVMVENISKNTSKEKLKELFSKYGTVKELVLLPSIYKKPFIKKNGKESKYCEYTKPPLFRAQVLYSTDESAANAVEAMHGKMVDGHFLVVQTIGRYNGLYDSKKTVHLSNLVEDTELNEIWKTFCHCGKIECVDTKVNKVTETCDGANVHFFTEEAASSALELNNLAKIMGQEVKVSKVEIDSDKEPFYRHDRFMTREDWKLYKGVKKAIEHVKNLDKYEPTEEFMEGLEEFVAKLLKEAREKEASEKKNVKKDEKQKTKKDKDKPVTFEGQKVQLKIKKKTKLDKKKKRMAEKLTAKSKKL